MKKVGSLEWWASKNFVTDAVDLTGYVKKENCTEVITSFVVDSVKDGEVCSPSFSLSLDSARLLMDALWSVGIRPTSGECSVGVIGATQKHLDDMRTIAFKLLSVSSPEAF